MEENQKENLFNTKSDENINQSSFKEAIDFDKTQAAFGKMISDFKFVQKLANILLPLVMIAYYIYSVITKTSETHLFFINLATLALLLTSYIAGIVYDNIISKKSEKKQKKELKKQRKLFLRVIKYLKHLVKLFAICFAVYEVITVRPSPIQILLVAFSVIAFLVQILIDVTTIIIEHYISLVTQGVQMDIEEFKSTKVYTNLYNVVDFASNFKTKSLELINKPLSSIAHHKENNESFVTIKAPSDDKKTIKLKRILISQAERIKLKRESQKKEKDELKKQQKQAKEEQKQAKFNEEKQKFKGYLSNIFGNDNKNK